jgi:hypothetical protein
MNRLAYYFDCPRGFSNEYTVCIATTRDARLLYEAKGYEPITRKQALRNLTYRGDAATQTYVDVLIDNRQPPASRFEIARDIRLGRQLIPF